MPSSKCLRAPLIVMSGVMMAVLASAGQASAAVSPAYPPPATVQVLGTSASTGSPVQVAGVTANAGTGLAFTGSNAIGVGALGGLLLVGGATLVLTSKRRKDNA